ncbi:MAG: 2-C-methyl-D-erythritol 4-phosphate cytidylyltransferase [Kiritimatiellae bacterium]|nr:2-C-methyl-D-erythritol 4-phosphate cytidylyltransferase [Kiritimatiellia bacterium]MDD4737214.1 2-C-methyl-D-erythritol 4-phosphate cytidylyltransferase [Kiritimatiellia bacterium]
MGHIVWGLIIAGGKSEQLSTGGADVALLNLAGKPVLYHALSTFEKCTEIDGIAVVAKREILPEIQQMAHLYGFSKMRKIAACSMPRSACLKTGMRVMDDQVTHVVVHDVSRPLLDGAVLSETVRIARRKGCGVACARIGGVVRSTVRGTTAQSTIDAGTLWETQTPYAVPRDVLDQMLNTPAKGKKTPCDEIQSLEMQGMEIKIVASPSMNLKIGDVADLALAEAYYKLINPERHAGGNPIS